jgi:5-bromo-4-chloroindolyl phosphate hydrolysis protein
MSNKRQSVLATIFSIASFLGLYFGLAWPILISAGLSIGIYFSTYLISKPRLKIGNVHLDTLPASGEMGQLLIEAKQDVNAIAEAAKKIKSESIKEQSEQLVKTSNNVLEYLANHPDQISNARRFLGYYLNTARDILEKYLKFQMSNLHTEEVHSVTQSTEKALPILNTAFEKQFTHLMQNDIMDIEADIKLLETNLKMEGFN